MSFELDAEAVLHHLREDRFLGGSMSLMSTGLVLAKLHPKSVRVQVDALRDQAVSRVACGAWHTAVIASPLPDGADSLDGLSFIERIALQHKLAAMYELTQEVRLGQSMLSFLRRFLRARFSQHTDSHVLSPYADFFFIAQEGPAYGGDCVVSMVCNL